MLFGVIGVVFMAFLKEIGVFGEGGGLYPF